MIAFVSTGSRDMEVSATSHSAPLGVPPLLTHPNITEGCGKSSRIDPEPHVIAWKCRWLDPECHHQSRAHLVDGLADGCGTECHDDI